MSDKKQPVPLAVKIVATSEPLDKDGSDQYASLMLEEFLRQQVLSSG